MTTKHIKLANESHVRKYNETYTYCIKNQLPFCSHRKGKKYSAYKADTFLTGKKITETEYEKIISVIKAYAKNKEYRITSNTIQVSNILNQDLYKFHNDLMTILIKRELLK